MSTGTTPIRKRPYPNLVDSPVVSEDIEALAVALDTAPTFTVGTLASRPTSNLAAGDTHFVTGDSTASYNGLTFQYDGTKWVCPHSMADGRVGEVREYTGTTDPVDPDGVTRWVIADGRPLDRSTYSVAYALMGVTWGSGNGTSTFNIPDRRGRVAVGAGQGTGLTNRALGTPGGAEAHTHSIPGLSIPGLSIPALGIPSLSVSVDSHRHSLSSAGGAEIWYDNGSGRLYTGGNGAAGPTMTAQEYGASLGATGISLACQTTALMGNTDFDGASGSTSPNATGGGTTGGGTTGGGTSGSSSTMPPFVGMNFIVRVQ